MKRKDNRLTFTLQIDEKIDTLIKDLRDRHRVNVSAICRDAIEGWHKKLESTYQKELCVGGNKNE